jgi:hypothetical protein
MVNANVSWLCKMMIQFYPNHLDSLSKPTCRLKSVMTLKTWMSTK